MLVTNQTVKSGDIVSFKLVNGDEIVGKLKEVQEGRYRVERPFAAMVTQQGLALVPLLVTGTEMAVVELSANHVMMVFDTSKEIADHYIKQTTGIQLATV